MSLFSYGGGFSKTSTSTVKQDFSSNKSTNSTSKEASNTRINQFDYAPKRFGLRYDPPTISKRGYDEHLVTIVDLTSLGVPHPLFRQALSSQDENAELEGDD